MSAARPKPVEVRFPQASDTAGQNEPELARELSQRVRGEVRFDSGSRALYATDASNYRQVPIGVVVPCDTDDVLETIAVCRRYGAPLLSRGGGTSLAGQCCNVAVVMDLSKHLRGVISVDPGRRLAVVRPGTVLDELRDAAREHGLTFGPDPATHDHCTIGGMVGNDSCGVHSLMAAFAGTGARTADNVEELEIATYDGVRMRVGRTSEGDLARILSEGGRRAEIYGELVALRDRYADRIRQGFPDIPRRVSGFNLPYLLPENGFHVARALVGSEGTCVTVLEVTANLIPDPAARALAVLGFEDVYAAADSVMDVLEHRPIGLEGMDERLIEDMRAADVHTKDLKLLPKGQGWLLVEFGGESREEAGEKARRLLDSMKDRTVDSRLCRNEAEQKRLWTIRESGLGATAHVPNKALTWPGWEDSAVPPRRLGEYLRRLRRLLEDHGYEGDFYGHFGQGCLHTRLDFDLESDAGIRQWRGFLSEAADLVVSLGGSLSGEHGDGQARAELLPKMFGRELVEAFRRFKRIWDPEGRMNPGKVVDAEPLAENLRLRTSGEPPPVSTHFAYREDEGSFDRAVLRCVGVGKCRRASGGTMCPSYMVTREEAHSTRGRARLLFEMLRGDTIRDGWRSPEVREALDLCLACKGCKGDCPVNVDMATYKAEFLSHHWKGRLRPRAAYAFGLIPWWSRLGSLSPGLVNFVTQTRGLTPLARLVADIAPERAIPALAPQTFRAWFRRRPEVSATRPPVLLFPDTFNNFYRPATARAAVAVLEQAGYRVTIPSAPLCCGRPLYDFGMLDLARATLRRLLRSVREPIRHGVPVVVLEPSCASVFRDELAGLFPDDDDARRLSRQTFLLAEFLEKKAPDFQPPRFEGQAIVQGHCHQQALMTLDDEAAILRRTGLDVEVLDSGCCGMAGAFGFERGNKYAVSMACGERVLLPRVRSAGRQTLIVADGFSCREQIRQGTDRDALHLAQVLRLPPTAGSSEASGRPPEAPFRDPVVARPGPAALATLLLGTAGLLLLARRH